MGALGCGVAERAGSNGRFKHVWRLLRAGIPRVWAQFGVALGVVGGSLALVVGWGARHAVWGLVILLAVAIAVIVEGSYRESRQLEAQLRQALEVAPEPQLERPIPRYERSEPYRHVTGGAGTMYEHRIGIRNPEGNPTATGVRLEWTEISPLPHVVYERFLPQTPQYVPRTTGGDPAIGVELPPGDEKLWMAVTTGVSGLAAVEFGQGYGKWMGLPWMLEPGDQLRLSYRVVSGNLPTAKFTLVMTATDEGIRCDLTG
jgi:hypothetical protein